MSMFESARVTHQKACETIILARAEWHQGIIFNMTAVQNYIASFLTRTVKNSCYVALGFEGAALYETIIMMERDALASFDGTRVVPHNVVWNTMMLPSTHDQVPLYLFGMQREHLMQYQILALQTPFSCCVLSSLNGALTALHQNNSDLSRATLSALKTHRTHALEQFLMQQTTMHTLTDVNKEINAGHVGLFLLGKHSYENSQ